MILFQTRDLVEISNEVTHSQKRRKNCFSGTSYVSCVIRSKRLLHLNKLYILR